MEESTFAEIYDEIFRPVHWTLVNPFPTFYQGCCTKNWSVHTLHFIMDAATRTSESIPYILSRMLQQKLVSPFPTFYQGCCNKHYSVNSLHFIKDAATKTSQSIPYILSGMLQQNKNWSVNVLYFIRDAATKQKLVSQFPKFHYRCCNKTKNWSVNSLHFISDAAIKTGQSIPYILSRTAIKTG